MNSSARRISFRSYLHLSTLLFGTLCMLDGLALSQTLSVPKPNEVQGSPLAEAARRGDRDAVQELLQQGFDVNGLGADGTPALQWAVRVADEDLVDTLLAAGADASAANRYGQSPIHVAVEYRHPGLLRKLVDAGADVETANASGEPALLIAARVGALDVVDALLALGADVNARDSVLEQSALMLAVREEHLDLTERLLAAGADVNARSLAGEEMRFILPAEVPVGTSKGVGINRMGWPDRGARQPIPGAKTPLLYATRQGNLALTRLLVTAGADLEVADANGITPLINAIINYSIVNVNRTGQSDHLKVAEFLVEAGANVNAQDWYGQTPLWAAVDIRNLEFSVTETTNRVDRDAAYSLIELLLDEGADPNSRTREFPPERRFIAGTGSNGWGDMTGQTPFLRAALTGDLKVMRLLLEHGADPNISTYEGTTPLMVAAGVTWAFSETYDEGADALLEAVQLTHSLGNDINAVNSMGVRAIHGAANRGSNAIISYLAENGALLNVTDNEGRSPIDWAEGVLTGARAPFRKPETIALLQKLQTAAELRRN